MSDEQLKPQDTPADEEADATARTEVREVSPAAGAESVVADSVAQGESPDDAAPIGLVANPEVPAPQPPAVAATPDQVAGPPAYGAADSPWARPASYPPTTPSGAQSGYAPPPALRLEEHAPVIGWAAVGGQAGYLSAPTAAVTATSAVVPAKPTEVRPSRFARVQLRTSLTILLFLAGVATGVVGLRIANPTRASTSDAFPTLDRSAKEPVPAGAVAQELAQNDVHGLAQLLDGDTLTAIQSQLKPLVSFESVTFVGATSLDKETLAGYVVRGRDQDGTLGLVGLVIRLRDGQVVAQ